MIQLFNTLLYQPIFNLLVYFYNVIPGHDVGLAILGITIVLKLLLFPLSLQSLKSQRALQAIQPKLKELQRKYKKNKQELAKATMKLYSAEKVSPFSSCLPLLIQFPFLIALYRVLIDGLRSARFDLLYPFVANPGQINPLSMGFVDLSQPNFILAGLAGVAQFLQAKMLPTMQPPKGAGPGSKDEGAMTAMNKQMIYFMPLITVFIGVSLPGGLVLYWFLTTVFTIFQQMYFFRKPTTALNSPSTPVDTKS